MKDISVEEVMTPGVLAISPSHSVSQVRELMRRQNVSCVVVCEKGTPVGVISERDIVVAPDDKLQDATVADLMSTPVVSVGSSANLSNAVALIRDRRIRRLPVTDDLGMLVGIVTQTDLLDAYARRLETVNEDLEQLVAERTYEVRRLAERFEMLSLEDPLLRIGNRRSMELALDRIHDLAARHGRIYTVVLIDIDHFKIYNDTYGHAEGDRVLGEVAGQLSSLMRGSDTIYRYGGEEILVLLPETDCSGARKASERLCEAVRELRIRHDGSPHGIVTSSCGVATVRTEGPGERDARWRDVITRADEALYRAKEAGRNCVVLASDVDSGGGEAAEADSAEAEPKAAKSKAGKSKKGKSEAD